jgi:hypothetical protein
MPGEGRAHPDQAAWALVFDENRTVFVGCRLAVDAPGRSACWRDRNPLYLSIVPLYEGSWTMSDAQMIDDLMGAIGLAMQLEEVRAYPDPAASALTFDEDRNAIQA